MGHTTGANIPRAIDLLGEAGFTVAQIASDLSLAKSTVYRWRRGQYAPNAENFEALVELVDQRHKQALAGRIYASAVHLAAAAEALVTVERAERREATADRLRTDQAAAEQRRHVADRAKHAELRELVARQRQAQQSRISGAVAAAGREPRRSAFADMDPFVVAGGTTDTLPF